jgi:hypothetical protein
MVLTLGLLAGPPLAAQTWDDAAIEEFLKTASVVDREETPRGVTRPVRMTLERDGETHEAVWKTVDEYKSSVRFSDGRTVFGFYDRWTHELAAYAVDRRIGLDMVPPTVERCFEEEGCGSLQLWVPDTITESERLEKGLSPPDPEDWNDQMFKVRLFHNLIDDIDYNNIGNLLVDDDFRIYVIDSSRAFRVDRQLQSPDNLERFSRSLLEGLARLDEEWLEEHSDGRLSKAQIKGLLHRRDEILERAERLIAERGQAEVLYD